jgi:hypothetical protein
MGIECNFVASGSSIDEIKKKSMLHLKEQHAHLIDADWTPAQMSDLDRMVEAKIKFS